MVKSTVSSLPRVRRTAPTSSVDKRADVRSLEGRIGAGAWAFSDALHPKSIQTTTKDLRVGADGAPTRVPITVTTWIAVSAQSTDEEHRRVCDPG